MKITVNFVSINGAHYVMPVGMTDKEVASLCAMLLMLRPLDSVYSSDYKSDFHYQMLDNATIRLGSRSIYVTEEAARAARDARNVEIEAAKDTRVSAGDARSRADDLALGS